MMALPMPRIMPANELPVCHAKRDQSRYNLLRPTRFNVFPVPDANSFAGSLLYHRVNTETTETPDYTPCFTIPISSSVSPYRLVPQPIDLAFPGGCWPSCSGNLADLPRIARMILRPGSHGHRRGARPVHTLLRSLLLPPQYDVGSASGVPRSASSSPGTWR